MAQSSLSQYQEICVGGRINYALKISLSIWRIQVGLSLLAPNAKRFKRLRSAYYFIGMLRPYRV
jgi:hypothetical protein